MGADPILDQVNWVGHAHATLGLLDRLGPARGVAAAEGGARYEPIDPSGEHHHHLVCGRCGEVRAFEDTELERAIERLSTRVDYVVDTHDVTLRGECPACRAGS